MAERITDYHDQCFLMDFMKTFIGLQGTEYLWAPHHVAEVQDTTSVDSITFMNRLASPSGQSLLENVPGLLMESIQPTIKLYKVYYKGKDDRKGVLLPLPFNNLSAGKASTGHVETGTYEALEGVPGYLGVNLEEFSFDYEGVNPAEVEFYLKAKLNLYCASVDAFFHQYTVEKDKKSFKVSFADLIKRPISKRIPGGFDTHLTYDESDFRIFIEIFYETPPGHVIDEYKKAHPTIDVSKFFTALEETKMSFFLNILKHEIHINPEIPTGPFKVEIEYVASVETALYKPAANILELFPETKEAVADSKNWAAVKVLEDWGKKLTRAGLGNLTGLGYEEVFPNKDYTALEKDIQRRAVAHMGETNQNVRTEADRQRIRLAVGLSEDNQAALEATQAAWEGSEGATGLGLEWSEKNFVLATNYFEARQRATEELKGKCLSEADLKTERYTRLLNSLFGRGTPKTGRPRNRVHTIQLPGEAMIDWINNRTNVRKISDERMKELKSKSDKGDKKAKKELQKLREGASAGARHFNKQFQNKYLLNASARVMRKWDRDSNKTAQEQAALNEAKEEVQDHVATESSKAEDTTSTEEQKKAEEKQNNVPANGEDYILQWFYFGDLIDAALDIVKENETEVNLGFPSYNVGTTELGNTHLIFGPCVYNDFTEGRQVVASLAKVPISLKLFREFWMNQVVKRNRSTYSFHQFLKDALIHLIGNVFTNRCVVPGEKLNRIRATYDHLTLGSNPSQRLTMQIKGFNALKNDFCPKANLQSGKRKPRGENITNLSSKSYRKAVKSKKYHATTKRNDQVIFVYATTNSLDHLKGKKKDDVDKGIYHIELGRSGVPVKEISFSKADIPGYLEAKGERAGLSGNPLELSEPYNVTFKTIGSTVFKPGKHFYLVLPHFGLPKMSNKRNPITAARVLGLGGYFMAHKISNVLRVAEARIDWYSDVEAIWVSFAKGEADFSEAHLSAEAVEQLDANDARVEAEGGDLAALRSSTNAANILAAERLAEKDRAAAAQAAEQQKVWEGLARTTGHSKL